MVYVEDNNWKTLLNSLLVDTLPQKRGWRIVNQSGTLQLSDSSAIGLVYGFLTPTFVQNIHKELECQSDFEAPIIRVFNYVGPIPRSQLAMGEPGTTYRYSNLSVAPIPWTPNIHQLRVILEELTGECYPYVLINKYEGKQQHIGWHSDDERDLSERSTISSFSIGDERRFMVKPSDHNSKAAKLTIPLKHNTLLLMGGRMQKEYKHQVPKERGSATAVRYNLTFRALKQPVT